MLAVAVVVPQAAAHIPDPVTRTNPVRVAPTGNITNGTLTTAITDRHAAATATASTGDTISLGPGKAHTRR